MGRYFGTDGIRGKANINLDVDRAFQVGKCLGYLFSKEGKSKIVIGKDTRLSSSMFENAIAAGIASCGADAYLVGYCPTPVIAYLAKNEDFACGVMISASHNPYYDNGIKVFSHEGIKLDAKTEEILEDYIDGKFTIELKHTDHIGSVLNYSQGLDDYLNWMESHFPTSLDGFNVALDCANGSATTTAEQLLTRLGAKCTMIHNHPDGLNINTKCGSTHPELLQQLVRDGNFDCGFAFDGDADRLIAVNSKGQLVDGDYILYICGQFMKKQGNLEGNTVVTTVMANLGFFKAMEKVGINTASTQVGDKYVYECMDTEGYVLGGEQSGHIIFKQHATTGDGLLTACKLLEIMKTESKSLIELSEGLKIYPQLLINVPVQDKEATLKDEKILQKIKDVETQLAGNGRILVRPSGTEPLVRVMVEAESDELCKKYVQIVVDMIQ